MGYCNIKKLNIVIYGGQKNKSKQIYEFLKTYPGVCFVGYADGYTEIDIKKINADILFVGLG